MHCTYKKRKRKKKKNNNVKIVKRKTNNETRTCQTVRLLIKLITN